MRRRFEIFKKLSSEGDPSIQNNALADSKQHSPQIPDDVRRSKFNLEKV
jgi:hypothetical protein